MTLIHERDIEEGPDGKIREYYRLDLRSRIFDNTLFQFYQSDDGLKIVKITERPSGRLFGHIRWSRTWDQYRLQLPTSPFPASLGAVVLKGLARVFAEIEKGEDDAEQSNTT